MNNHWIEPAPAVFKPFSDVAAQLLVLHEKSWSMLVASTVDEAESMWVQHVIEDESGNILVSETEPQYFCAECNRTASPSQGWPCATVQLLWDAGYGDLE